MGSSDPIHYTRVKVQYYCLTRPWSRGATLIMRRTHCEMYGRKVTFEHVRDALDNLESHAADPAGQARVRSIMRRVLATRATAAAAAAAVDEPSAAETAMVGGGRRSLL